MTQKSHPFLFAVVCARNLVMIRACFGAVLGLLWVAVVVCMTIVIECDKKPKNSLYWDIDATIAHPFCDHFSIGRKICD